MRICLLTRSLYPVIGGSETYVYSVGKALGELGHDVTVVTSTLPDECGRAHPYPFRVLRVPELSEFNAAQSGLRTLVPLHETLRQLDPDVIHVQNALLGIAVTLLADAIPDRCGIVFTDHNTAMPDERRWISGIDSYDVELALGQFAFRRGAYDFAVAPSEAFHDWALRCGAPPEKLLLVRHGVDTTLFAPAPARPDVRLRLCGDRAGFLVLAPGRMLRRKGILPLLGALDEPLLIGRNVHLAITTTTNTSERDFFEFITATVRARNCAHRVSLHVDAFAPEEMPSVYRASDCVAFLSSAEGFGLVGIEALACGVPVVARPASGIREYLEHGVTGLFVEDATAPEIARTLARVVDDRALRAALIRNGRERVVKNFALCDMARALEQVYARACSRGS